MLTLIPQLMKWVDDVLVYATDPAINHGKEWSGFKLVEGRSVRKLKDETTVIEKAKAHGLPTFSKLVLSV